MSVTRFNQNGTVSIVGLTRDEYNAIAAIVSAAEMAFDNQSGVDDAEYHATDDFRCTLTINEKKAMDKRLWSL